MSLGARARAATLWSAIQQIGVNGVNTLFVLVFARFLSAEDFGLFAAAALVIGFASKIAIFGLNTVIVQRETMDRRTLSTAFWLTLGAAAVIAGALSAASVLATRMFGDPALALLLPVMSLGLVANVIATVIGALFSRRLDIRRLTQRTLVAGVIGGCAAVPLAAGGFGVWTLVVHFVLTSVLAAAVTLWLADRPVGLTWDRGAARELLAAGLPIFVTDLVKYFSAESPRLFVALFLSIEALGVFSLATRILTLVQQLTLTPLSTIAVPVFSEISRQDRARLPELFAMTLRAFLLLVLPAIAAAILVIDTVVLILLGDGWAAAGAPAALLLAGALFLPIPFICDAVLVGTGNTRDYLRFSLLRAGVGAGLLLVLAPFGILHAALAFVLRGLFVEPLLFAVTLRRIGAGAGPVARDVVTLYGATLAAGALAHVAGSALAPAGLVVEGALTLAAFAGLYALAVALFAPAALRNLLSLAGRRAAQGETP